MLIEKSDKVIIVLLLLIIFSNLLIIILDTFIPDSTINLIERSSVVNKVFTLLIFPLSYFIFFSPLILLFISLNLYKASININWHIHGIRKIEVYSVLFIAFFFCLYFFYALLYMDPEIIFLYLFWPCPIGFILLIISTIISKNGSRLEHIICRVGRIIGLITLIGPFIVTMFW